MKYNWKLNLLSNHLLNYILPHFSGSTSFSCPFFPLSPKGSFFFIWSLNIHSLFLLMSIPENSQIYSLRSLIPKTSATSSMQLTYTFILLDITVSRLAYQLSIWLSSCVSQRLSDDTEQSSEFFCQISNLPISGNGTTIHPFK